MDIRNYLFATKTSQSKFAELVGTTQGMVYQWINAIRPVSPEKCVIIERVTSGLVTRKDLRPNDWQDIWPELVNQ